MPVAQVVIDDGGSRTKPSPLVCHLRFGWLAVAEVSGDTITVTRYAADGTPLDDISALGGGDIVTTTTPTTGTPTLVLTIPIRPASPSDV